MSLEFTPDGLTIDSLQDAFESLADELRVIYGNDIDLSQNSPDGQRVGVYAKAQADAQAALLELYNSLDPDFARGLIQQKLLKISGITIRPATRSTWDIDVTVSRETTLQAGYRIVDDLGQIWEIASAITIPSGTTTVTFRSVDFGRIEGQQGATLEQSTFVTSVTGLDAPVDATLGVDEETEQQVRVRRNRSLQLASRSQVGRISALLGELPDVSDVRVYENDTDTTDGNGIPANALYCVVEGGIIADIAEVIAKEKTIGSPTFGDETGIFSESIERPSGGTYEVDHEINFSRPTPVDLYIRVTATRTHPNDPIDLARLQNAILEKVYFIGEPAFASTIYDFGYQGGSNFILTELEISDDDVTYVDGVLSPGIDGKFFLDAARIEITEVES